MLLTTEQVAERLQVSTSTVKRLVAAGDLQRLKVRTSTRIDSSDVDAYVARLRGDRHDPKVAGITEGQLRAFHAKANELDRMRKQPRGTAKAEILERAPDLLGHVVESAGDLTAPEASALLDELDAQLRGMRE